MGVGCEVRWACCGLSEYDCLLRLSRQGEGGRPGHGHPRHGAEVADRPRGPALSHFMSSIVFPIFKIACQYFKIEDFKANSQF